MRFLEYVITIIVTMICAAIGWIIGIRIVKTTDVVISKIKPIKWAKTDGVKTSARTKGAFGRPAKAKAKVEPLFPSRKKDGSLPR